MRGQLVVNSHVPEELVSKLAACPHPGAQHRPAYPHHHFDGHQEYEEAGVL